MAKKIDKAEVNRIWDELEDEHPNASTEWLLQMTCDLYREFHKVEINHGDVAHALKPDE